MRTLTRMIALCAALGLTAPTYASNLISNGDFNASPAPECVNTTINVPDWTVVSGNVDVYNANYCNPPAPPPGSYYYLDLTGTPSYLSSTDVGVIEQSFGTTVGDSYAVSFYFGADYVWQTLPNIPNDSPIKSMNALINGNVQGTYSVNTAGILSPQWTLVQFNFTSTNATTTLGFQSLNGITTLSYFGPQLADVQVVQAPSSVPEPASLALFAAGLCVIAFSRRCIARSNRV